LLATPLDERTLHDALELDGIEAGGVAGADGYPGRSGLVVQCTEMTTEAEMDALVRGVTRIVTGSGEKAAAG
ncbi:MAG: hypothetical protein KGQ88_00885, partial [Chloroflexi bacterium]|nr:hypothetical protein [Chloroflexota bacterium]